MRIFITHVASRKIGLDKNISVAATNFSYNLATGVNFDKVYSILPPFVRGGKSKDYSDNIIQAQYSIFRRTPFSKLAAIIEQLCLFLKIPSYSNLWLYNVTALNGYLVKLLKKFKPSVKIFPIILDYTPNDVKSEKWVSLINQSDGKIFLSNSSNFNSQNSWCLPGIVPLELPKAEFINKPSPDFLISGQLSDNISMLSNLLEVFANMPYANLHITGSPTSKAEEYANAYPNIICHGKLDYEQYKSVLQKCPFLLSTRNPNLPENRCNFPSKIIEGLLYNRIIISTIDYPQLNNIRYIKIDANNLKDSIKVITELPDKDLMGYANQSKRTAELFNPNVWDMVMSNLETNAE